MILQLMFQIILLSRPMIVFAQAPPNITKPNCPSRCGNVSIPFPFGIGVGCYIDDWFAIDCISNKPFIRSIKLEVLEITLSSNTMRVNHPAFNSCQEQTTSESVDLEKTPFVFSNTSNRFASVACNSLAMISTIDSVVAGCLSSCDNNWTNNRKGSTCNGVNCCQTTIPLPLKKFNVSVDSSDGGRQQECGQASLVDQQWLISSLMNPQDVQGMTQLVPVTLDWGIYYSTFDPFAWKKSKHYYWPNSKCEISAFSGSQFRVVRCYCNSGYEGNPYLPEGCQDVVECERDDKICGPLLNCSNNKGTYICHPPFHNSGMPASTWIVAILMTVISPTLAGLFIITVVSRQGIIIRRRMKRKEKFFKRNGSSLLQRLISSDGSVDRCKIFNSNELKKATDGFNVNRILGQGGQGTVYKGMLTDGKIVAIKKSKVVNEGKLEEFINEVVILSQINHRNVVKLLIGVLFGD